MKQFFLGFIGFALCLVAGCHQPHPTNIDKEAPTQETISQKQSSVKLDQATKQKLIQQYRHHIPTKWGEQVKGVKYRLQTQEKVVALTLDACGGPNGSQYDHELIDYLIQHRIPATLFINQRWIDANPSIFQQLAQQSLFEIANHGTNHLPLSVTGNSVYGMKGTNNVEEVIEEIWRNHQKIEQLTGKAPRFFRSGTAYYDDVAVQIANELGVEVVNFDVNGDAGATKSKNEVKEALLSVQPGSIVILHMNQPHQETAEGVKEAIPILKKRGYRFVKLTETSLQSYEE